MPAGGGGRLGAAVVVTPALDFGAGRGGAFTVTAAVRDPGGAWSAPRTVVPGKSRPETDAVAAVSERGDAALAVTTSDRDAGPARLLVARRAPGGAFAAPVTVLTTHVGERDPAVRLGFAAGGELRGRLDARRGLRVRPRRGDRPAGRPVRPVQRIGGAVAPMPPGLAVAPDGRALLAFAAGGQIQVAERAPGAGFGPAAPLGAAADPIGDDLAVASGAGGAAVVAWQGVVGRGVSAAVRPAGGAFGAPVTLRRAAPTSERDGNDSGPIDIGFAEDLLFGGHLGVAVAGDRATVVWPRDAVTRGLCWRGADAASVPLAGGPTAAELLGSPLRDVGSEAPLTLADGTAAVAWGDAADAGGDRVHLALAGPRLPRRAGRRVSAWGGRAWCAARRRCACRSAAPRRATCGSSPPATARASRCPAPAAGPPGWPPPAAASTCGSPPERRAARTWRCGS